MHHRYIRLTPSSGTVALAVCAAFATGHAFAANRFPPGTYSPDGGALTATFDDKGNVQVKKGGELEVEGSYSISADQIELTDSHGPWACTKPAEKSGTYRWTYDNGTLTFSDVGDKCKGRSESLTAKSWKKQ